MHICLLDIDGTLVETGGAGQTAFARTLAAEFGIPQISRQVTFAGRSDRAIAMDLFRVHGVPPTAESWQRFSAGYLARLEEALPAHRGRVLPGVHELLRALAARGDVAIGLLTGNVREAARRKLSHYDLWHWFPFGGFGDDHVDRDDIAAAALAAARRHIHESEAAAGSEAAADNPQGAARDPANDSTRNAAQDAAGAQSPPPPGPPADAAILATRQVLVIGDTLNDISCGRSIGARSVAVPTGQTPVDVLRRAEPDLLVETLEQIEPILALLDE